VDCNGFAFLADRADRQRGNGENVNTSIVARVIGMAFCLLWFLASLAFLPTMAALHTFGSKRKTPAGWHPQASPG
jgi:hypothetical protein